MTKHLRQSFPAIAEAARSDLISGFGCGTGVSCTKHLSRSGHDPILAIVMPGCIPGDLETHPVPYRQRLATVEPAFGHLRHAKGLHRFTLRGKQKINGQWQLYCTVHNLFEIHQYGPGDT